MYALGSLKSNSKHKQIWKHYIANYGLLLLGNSVWEEYCVIAAFNGDGKAQVSAESGDQVILLNKDPSGREQYL